MSRSDPKNKPRFFNDISCAVDCYAHLGFFTMVFYRSAFYKKFC